MNKLAFVGFLAMVGLSAACAAPVEEVSQGSQSVVRMKMVTGTLARCDRAKDTGCQAGDPVLVAAEGRQILKAKAKANVAALALLMSDELVGAKVKLTLAEGDSARVGLVSDKDVTVWGAYREGADSKTATLKMANGRVLPVLLDASYADGPDVMGLTGVLVRRDGLLVLDMTKSNVVTVETPEPGAEQG